MMFGVPLLYLAAGGGLLLLLVVIAVVLKLRRGESAPRTSFIPAGPSLAPPSLNPRSSMAPRTSLAAQAMSHKALAQAAIGVAEAARDAILWARSADRSPSEGKDRPPSGQREDGPIVERRHKIYAAIGRMRQRQDVFEDLDRIQRQFQALFGPQEAKPLGVISDIKSMVIARTETLLQLDIAAKGDPRKEYDKRRILEITCGLRTRDDGSDPIAQKLEEALIPLRAFKNAIR